MSKLETIGSIKKSNAKSKRWIRIALLLCLVMALSVLLMRDQQAQAPFASTVPTVTPSSTGEVSSQSGRDEREVAYEQDVATLEELINNETLDDSTKAQAVERLTQLVSDHQSEIGIEEALQSAGFDPVLVLMQYGSLTVMVEASTLTQAQSVTILSICVAHSDIAVENIRIMTSQKI